MVLTAAERARNYSQRVRLDPTKRQQYLEKERIRKREAYKSITEKSERAQRLRGRRWRQSSQIYRKTLRDCKKSKPKTCALNPLLTLETKSLNDRRISGGCKKVKRERAKVYRDLDKEKREKKSSDHVTSPITAAEVQDHNMREWVIQMLLSRAGQCDPKTSSTKYNRRKLPEAVSEAKSAIGQLVTGEVEEKA